MYYRKIGFFNLNNIIINKAYYAKRRISINHISLVNTNDSNITGYAILHFLPFDENKKIKFYYFLFLFFQKGKKFRIAYPLILLSLVFTNDI